MLPKSVLISFLLTCVGANDLAVVGTWPELISASSNQDQVPLRQNINKFQREGGPKWDLYIQALRAMYEMPDSEPLSYFQTAGIHGLPFVEWGATGASANGGGGGYCPHGELLFLPWHRPYVVRFEQTLSEHAKRIAERYPDSVKEQYKQAADNFRVPYWDWAAESRVPDAVLPQKIKIKAARNGTVEEVDVPNPLNTYNFPKAATSGQWGSFSSADKIRHCPAPNKYPDTANKALKKANYARWVYDVFTRVDKFADFGTVTAGYFTLEAIHNKIHWDGACKGQFLDSSYTGFDPLFWLHHTNVDRLWAYWQYAKPEATTLISEYNGTQRWASAEGAKIDRNSPLTPFMQEDGTMHTADTVRSIEDFGYTYEGLEYWNKSPEQLKNDAIALINNMYGPNRKKRRGMNPDAPATRYFAKISVDAAELEKPCVIQVSMKGQGAGEMVVMAYLAKGIVNGGVLKINGAMASLDRDKMLKKQIEISIVLADGSTRDAYNVSSLNVDIEEVHVTPPTRVTELPKIHLGRVIPSIKNGTKEVTDGY